MEASLMSGGSALHAALAGYFAAAGEHSGVLLSPMAILLHGFGARRAFDGRLRQPGQGVKRPRGFTPGQVIPPAARVGIPCSVVAACVALAYDTSNPIGQLTGYGAVRAKKAGAEKRLELLQHVGRLGAGAFTASHVHRPIVLEAGLTEQGVVTEADFAATPEVDKKCAEASATDGNGAGVVNLSLPWASHDTAAEGNQDTLCVVDARGSAVCVAYQNAASGLEIAAWEVVAPLVAAPVMRGVSRVPPGTPIATPFQIRLVLDNDGRVVTALGGRGLDTIKAHRA
jgi:hypothetical protein